MLRLVVFRIRAKEEIRQLPRDVRLKLGSALFALQRGFSLGMPVSRPMPVVMPGVEELWFARRIRAVPRFLLSDGEYWSPRVPSVSQEDARDPAVRGRTGTTAPDGDAE